MASDTTKQGAGLVGVGAAACAACGAGPILGVLAAAGLLTAAAYLTAGLIGLAVVMPLTVSTIRRRGQRDQCAVRTGPGRRRAEHEGNGRVLAATGN